MGERTIKFKTPIPVYVTYQTAFVDQSGKLQTRADIYGLDKDVLAQLKGDSKVADVPIARNYSSGSKPVMGGVPRSSRRDDYAESFGGGPGWGPNYAQGEQGGRSNNAFSRFRVW